LPPGLPLEMTCPPSPSLFGIQFPGASPRAHFVPLTCQRSGNSRIVVDVSSVGAPPKPSGLPQWTHCTELVPKLIVRVRFPSPAPHAKSVAGQSNRVPLPMRRERLSSSETDRRALSVLLPMVITELDQRGTSASQYGLLPRLSGLRRGVGVVDPATWAATSWLSRRYASAPGRAPCAR